MSSSCGISPSVRTEFFNPNSNRFLAPSRIYHQPICHSHEGSKCEMNGRGFALKGIVASGVSVLGFSLTSEPVLANIKMLAVLLNLSFCLVFCRVAYSLEFRLVVRPPYVGEGRDLKFDIEACFAVE